MYKLGSRWTRSCDDNITSFDCWKALLSLDSHQHLVVHALAPAQTSQWTTSGLWRWTVSHSSQTGSFIFALVPFMTGLTLEISISNFSAVSIPWLYDLVWPPPTLRYRYHMPSFLASLYPLKPSKRKHTDTLAWKIACMHTPTPCMHASTHMCTHTHTHTGLHSAYHVQCMCTCKEHSSTN